MISMPHAPSQSPSSVASPVVPRFNRFARGISRATGHPLAFALAFLVILAWAVTGPIFHFSDTWQLVINTGTTVVTFLMVFLIQSSQNRDSQAVQMKLDELIRAVEGAQNAMIDVEDRDEEELETLRKEYASIATQARKDMESGKADAQTIEHEAEGMEKDAAALKNHARKARKT